MQFVKSSNHSQIKVLPNSQSNVELLPKIQLTEMKLSRKNVLSQNCRINYVGRNLRGYLVQPPLESSVNTEFKSGCSGLCPLRSWNSLEMDVLQPLQPPVPMLGCSQGEKYFSYIKSEPPLFQSTIPCDEHCCCSSLCAPL